MKDEGKDEHDIKNMLNQILETQQTLVTCVPRIETAIEDLENCMAGFEEGDAEKFALLKETEEWKAATA